MRFAVFPAFALGRRVRLIGSQKPADWESAFRFPLPITVFVALPLQRKRAALRFVTDFGSRERLSAPVAE